MKKTLTYFLNSPKLVTTLALVVAFGVGYYEYQKLNVAPAYQFVRATSGSIASPVTSDGDSQHVSLSFPVSGRVQSISVKVGDKVKKGVTLATLDPESTLGAMTQAEAAYASAQANYQKVLNGATSATIDVANSGVDTAQQNLDHVIQNTYTQIDNLVRTNVDSLYQYPNSNDPQFQVTFFDTTTNTNIILVPTDTSLRLDLGNKRGDLNKLLASWKNAADSSASSSAGTANAGISSSASVKMSLDSLAAVKAYLNAASDGLNALNYSSKYASYVEKHKGDISAARSSVDTLINTIQNDQLAVQNAKTNVAAVTTSARPEDIATAKAQMNSALGSLQIARAAYSSRTMFAPGDGVVTAVKVNAGEISSPNETAIELSGSNFAQTVSLMLPKNTIINRDGKNYVMVKVVATSNASATGNVSSSSAALTSSGSTSDRVEEREVTLGASDNQNVEIVSGITADDEVVIR
jgi:HlyD family secretion protein